MSILPPHLVVVSTADRPDLVPVVAEWLWDAFWRQGGHSLEATHAAVESSVTARPMPRTFILLQDGAPVGTASLAADDLAERPDLTPWLAGVVVAPRARRQGFAAHLIAAVEAEAAALGFATLWLYTSTAERIYARAGWRTVEIVQHRSKALGGQTTPVALMRRDLHDRLPS